MSRTKKSTFALTSALTLLINWVVMLLEEVKKLGGDTESIYDFFTDKEKIAETAKIVVERKRKGIFFQGNKYLKLISGKEDIIIDACDGAGLLLESDDVFAYIDPDFKDYNTNERSGGTKATRVEIYELAKDSRFTDIFNSIGVSMDKLCLTRGQIESFIRKHKNWLRTEEYATFFLFKSRSKFFVAFAYCDNKHSRSKVFVRRLESDIVWYANCRNRVAIPQLEI